MLYILLTGNSPYNTSGSLFTDSFTSDNLDFSSKIN